MVEWGIDNFPRVSHSGKNGCRATQTRHVLAYIRIPHLAPHEPVTHKERREGSSFPPPINISCRSANFQQISHEKAGRGLRCVVRRGVPGGLTPAAAASWLQVSFGLAGPAQCQKLALSPVSGCWFYLSSVSWICKNSWVFFFFLVVVCKPINVQKPIYLFQGRREGGEKKIQN